MTSTVVEPIPPGFGREIGGRLRDWVPASDWGSGRYRLVFETGGAFFPEVVVVFEVLEPSRPHHVPLLLSPYGYTTYRGT